MTSSPEKVLDKKVIKLFHKIVTFTHDLACKSNKFEFKSNLSATEEVSHRSEGKKYSSSSES